MSMFFRRDLINEPGVIKRFFTTARTSEVVHHRLRIGTGFGAQIDHSPRPGFQNVIALILGVVHPELLLDVLGNGVDLEAQILAANGIEEVKTDRELRTETRVNFLAQQSTRLEQDQILRGDLDPHCTKTQ